MGRRHLHNRNRWLLRKGQDSGEIIQYFNMGHAMGHWHEAGERLALFRVMPEPEE